MHYVFDFGGVLFQWRPAEVLRRVLPERVTDDVSARHWLSQFFQSYGGDWGEFDRGTIEVDELVPRIAARTGLTTAEVQGVVDAVPSELQLRTATAAMIERLQQAGRRLFFLSNMPAPYAAHLRAAHPLHDWFEDGVFSSDHQLIKPDPAIFALAQSRFGLPARELVFFDDHPVNVEAARAAGWQAVLFHDAAQAEAELRAAGLWPSPA